MQGKQDAVGREENQKLNTVAGVLLGVFLLAAWWTLPDYGITYDCHEYFLGDKNLVYLVTREGTHLDYAADSVPIHQRASHLDLHANSVFAAENPQEIWPFGAVVTSISKHGLFGLGLVDDVFDAHHAILPLLVALLGWFVFRFVAREIGPWAGLIAIVCLLSYPRFWAHLHNNYKDIPSAVWFSLVVLSFYHGIEHRRVKQIILAAVLWGAALATKGNALFLPFVVGVWFWYVIYRRVRSSQTGELIVERRAIMALCAFPFIGLAVAALLWPYLMQNFPDHLLLHWDYIRERGATGPDHWQLAAVGKVLSMTPPVMLVLMGCGLACIAYRSGRGRAVSNLDALLLLWLTVPVLRVSVPRAHDFDGIRHWIEFVVPAAIIASIGATWLGKAVARRIPQPRRSLAAGVAILLIHLPALYWNARLHPYQICYYNFLVGGLGGAQERMIDQSTDYWGSSYRQGCAWLNENAEADAGLVVGMGEHIVRYTAEAWLRPDIVLISTDGMLKDEALAESAKHDGPVYLMYITRWRHYNMLTRSVEARRKPPLHQIVVDGGVILKIYRLDAELTKR